MPDLQAFVNALRTTWPAKLAEDAYHGFLAPGQALQSTPNNPVTTEQLIKPAQDMVTLLAGGAPKAEAGAFGILGGKGAKTANIEKLEKAMRSEDSLPSDAIWRETGWERSPSDNWRFEIPDIGSKINAFGSQPKKLGDVLEHPALYKAYPEFAEYEVTPWGPAGYHGTYTPQTKEFYLNPSIPESRSTLLHEVQHAVQHKEGFPSGSIVENNYPEGYDALRNKLVGERIPNAKNFLASHGLSYQETWPAVQRYLDKKELSPADIGILRKVSGTGRAGDIINLVRTTTFADRNLEYPAYIKYRNYPGELEASAVQRRMGTPVSNRITPPSATEDIIRALLEKGE